MGNFCRKDQQLIDDNTQLHLQQKERGGISKFYDLFKPEREIAKQRRLYKSEDPRAKLERKNTNTTKIN